MDRSTEPPIIVERRRCVADIERILRSLPERFGIEEAIQGYVHDAEVMPTYAAIEADRVVGIALVIGHFAESAEIHLIAVHPNYHRRGVGRMLVSEIEVDLRADGVEILQVHTVGPSYPDAGYELTRQFYRGLGFRRLQEVSGIGWDGPTLMMVKVL